MQMLKDEIKHMVDDISNMYILELIKEAIQLLKRD